MNTSSTPEEIRAFEKHEKAIQALLRADTLLPNIAPDLKDTYEKLIQNILEVRRGVASLDDHMFSGITQRSEVEALLDDYLSPVGTTYAERLYNTVAPLMDGVDGNDAQLANILHSEILKIQTHLGDGGFFLPIDHMYNAFFEVRIVRNLPENEYLHHEASVSINAVPADKREEVEQAYWNQLIERHGAKVYKDLEVENEVKQALDQVEKNSIEPRRQAMVELEKMRAKRQSFSVPEQQLLSLLSADEQVYVIKVYNGLDKLAMAPYAATLQSILDKDPYQFQLEDVRDVKKAEVERIVQLLRALGSTTSERAELVRKADALITEKEENEVKAIFGWDTIPMTKVKNIVAQYHAVAATSTDVDPTGDNNKIAIFKTLGLNPSDPVDHDIFASQLENVRKLEQKYSLRELIEKRTVTTTQAENWALQAERLLSSPKENHATQRRRAVESALVKKKSELEQEVSKLERQLDTELDKSKRKKTERILDTLGSRYQNVSNVLQRYQQRGVMLTLEDIEGIEQIAPGVLDTNTKDKLTEGITVNAVDEVLDSSEQVYSENIRDEELALQNLDAVLMTPPIKNMEAYTDLVKERLVHTYRSKGEEVPQNLDQLTLDEHSWFHIKSKRSGGVDEFMRFDELISPKIEDRDEKIMHFASLLLDSAQKYPVGDTTVSFAMNEKEQGITSIKTLEEGIATFLTSGNESEAKKMHITVKPDSVWKEGSKEFIVKSSNSDHIRLRGYKDKLPLAWFYLQATHPNESKRLKYDEEKKPEDVEYPGENQNNNMRWWSFGGMFGSLKSLFEMRKERREHIAKMRNDVVLLQLGEMRFPSLLHETEGRLQSQEEKYYEEIKHRLEHRDEAGRKELILQFMKEVRPGRPNIHAIDGPLHYSILGKRYAHIEARAIIKGMLLFCLENYGQLYPFAEMNGSENRYWLDVFTPTGSRGKAKESALKKQADDGRTEYSQLLASFRNQPGLFGYSFESKVKQAAGSGEGKAKERIEADLSSTVTTGDIVQVINEYLRDGRWEQLQIAIEKLCTKGAKVEDLFNIFLYIFDQVRFSEGGEYYSEYPFEKLQSIGKAVFVKYPDIYYFMFRNKKFFNDFATSIDKRIDSGHIARGKHDKIKWDMSDESSLPKPVTTTEPPLYQIYTMDGGCFEILRGYAKQPDPYLGAISNYLNQPNYSFDAGMDENMWTRNTLLAASAPAFAMIPANWKQGGFDHIHMRYYLDRLIQDAKELHETSSIPREDRDAYMAKVQKLFYENVYARLNVDKDTIKQHLSKDKQRKRVVDGVVIEKHERMMQESFLKEYYDRLSSAGLSFNDCARHNKNVELYQGQPRASVLARVPSPQETHKSRARRAA